MMIRYADDKLKSFHQNTTGRLIFIVNSTGYPQMPAIIGCVK